MAKQPIETPRRRGLRLLPLTITMLSLFLVVKVNELYLGSRQLREMYAVRDAVASEKKEEVAHGKTEEPAKDAGHGAAEKPKDTAAEHKTGEEKPVEVDAKKDPAAEHDKAEEKKEDGHGAKSEDGHGAAKPPEEPKTFGTGKTTVKEIEALKARDAQPRYTQTELDLLQNLSKRRDELDRRERDLEIKSKVLEATDKRIADKMVEMKTMQGELSKVLAQYNEKQDAQIKSLVKIYESMKPEEAAAIFNELEMPILLEVIGKMSERKVALVLANMNPKRARDVTQELADKRKKSAVGAEADGRTPVAAAPKP